MNGTVIDIKGINVSVIPINLEDSTDKAYTITISDSERSVILNICFGKITDIIEYEENSSSKL